MMPKISVSPDATSARIMPVTIPLTLWMMRMSQGMLSNSANASHSEILVDHGVIHRELRGRCLVPDGPFLHEVHALACRQRQRHVLFDQQNRHPVAMQNVDDFPDLRHHARH